ncbi:hypothetical protein AVEN_116953-1, partial [Araneus ventricosus]
MTDGSIEFTPLIEMWRAEYRSMRIGYIVIEKEIGGCKHPLPSLFTLSVE